MASETRHPAASPHCHGSHRQRRAAPPTQLPIRELKGRCLPLPPLSCTERWAELQAGPTKIALKAVDGYVWGSGGKELRRWHMAQCCLVTMGKLGDLVLS